MTMFRLVMLFFSVMTLLLFTHPDILHCKYYEYIDENGVKTFTDDESLIPEDQREATKIHKERYDDLDKNQKREMIEKEQEEIDRLNRETKAIIDRIEGEEEEERLRQLEIEKQKRQAALRTPVTLTRNRILIPVTFKYYGRETTVTMLLDTGASITSVNQFVAEQLDITSGERSAARVAGGGILMTKTVDVDLIKVGPKALKRHKIMVFEHKGPREESQGLLGQDFLQKFGYTIDYDESVIVWDE